MSFGWEMRRRSAAWATRIETVYSRLKSVPNRAPPAERVGRPLLDRSDKYVKIRVSRSFNGTDSSGGSRAMASHKGMRRRH